MSRFALICAALVACISVSAAQADDSGDTLRRCIMQHITDSDHVVLSRFIFAAIAENPDVKPYVKLNDNDRTQMNANMSALLIRLWRTDCHAESIAAIRAGGQFGLLDGLNALSGASMRSLMEGAVLKGLVGALGTPDIIAEINALKSEARGNAPVPQAAKP